MINCCYNDCTVQVWRKTDDVFDVCASSATCLGCRQVVFCLSHFTEIYAGKAQYTCPNCNKSEWWLCLYEGDTIAPLLKTALIESGATLEERPRPLSDPTRAASNWMVNYQSQLPVAYRFIGNGLCYRHASQQTDIWLKGLYHTLPGAMNITAGDVSPMGRHMVVLSEASNGALLTCSDGNSVMNRIYAAPGEVIRAPRFVDETRFVFLKGPPAGLELIEANFESTGRMRSRRVAHIGTVPSGPVQLAVSNRDTVYTCRQVGSDCTLVSIPLAYGSALPISQLSSPPRCLVASDASELLAWIDWHGEVRYMHRGEAPKLIGRTTENLLALSSDGQQIAWMNSDRIEIADLASGTFSHNEAGADAIYLGWRELLSD